MADTIEKTEKIEKLPIKVTPPIEDDDQNTTLHHAAAKGDVDKFKKEFTEDMKIDVVNFLGWTPLMMACRNGHIEMAKHLLELRADASKSNYFGFSVFMISIASRKMELTEIILRHLLCGGISREKMQSIISPISLAILFQDQDIVSFLITKGFDLNAGPSDTGLTPLMFAAAMEDSASYKKLLQNGADPYKKNQSGSTAMEIKQFMYNERHAPLTPAEMISLSPHMQQPFPAPSQAPLLQPNMVPGVGAQQNIFLHRMRHSSNVADSPLPMMSPVSPIPIYLSPLPAIPNNAPQLFFSSDFSPNAAVSPNAVFVMSPVAPPPSPMNFPPGSFINAGTNSFLNHALTESFSNMFLYSPQHNVVNESA
ncbi:unnamed protein product [Acanthoscelides obtectus]|uniref:Uncharacterized protein n=1 Tax=Acanthoscelides obtectus TaxID=200917 RepID=A0A9P0LP72_ACAOB|nr:unnamed protein product [Acanthoscelides obtectus]CAK1620684.1 Ankyrin repeat and SAM domain-containing protein 6 [Acanthoscelides obtectus]